MGIPYLRETGWGGGVPISAKNLDGWGDPISAGNIDAGVPISAGNLDQGGSHICMKPRWNVIPYLQETYMGWGGGGITCLQET